MQPPTHAGTSSGQNPPKALLVDATERETLSCITQKPFCRWLFGVITFISQGLGHKPHAYAPLSLFIVSYWLKNGLNGWNWSHQHRPGGDLGK